MQGCSHTLATSSCQFLRTKELIPGLGCGLTSPDFPVCRGVAFPSTRLLSVLWGRVPSADHVLLPRTAYGPVRSRSKLRSGRASGKLPRQRPAQCPKLPGALAARDPVRPALPQMSLPSTCSLGQPLQVATKQRRGHCHTLPSSRTIHAISEEGDPSSSHKAQGARSCLSPQCALRCWLAVRALHGQSAPPSPNLTTLALLGHCWSEKFKQVKLMHQHSLQSLSSLGF